MAKPLVLVAILLASVYVCVALPPNFMYGMATAAYQVEGAWNVSGRGPSIWDTFSHTPGKVADGSTGDVADDFYHLYEEDVKLMVKYKLTHFRLSLSWSRILPQGTGVVNQAGIDFYNRLINILLAHNIQPAVTLYHWDMPQALENAYQSWLSPNIVSAFNAYADVCFAAFGDRVKLWFTLNEPHTFTDYGYGRGVHAPGRCSNRTICQFGNSTTEPWIVSHHTILAHAEAVHTYRTKYRSAQGGQIGIVLNSDWNEPWTSNPADVAATQRNLDFMLGRFADPIWFGDYPPSMRSLLGPLLPRFTPEQKARVRGSYDFFAINHYTSRYVSAAPVTETNLAGTQPHDKSVDGTPIGPVADSDWLIVVPWGFQKLLKYIWDRYQTPILITENGCDVPNESKLPLAVAIKDEFRVNYYTQYLSNMLMAMQYGVNIRGYFAWSFMDNFEWSDGYEKRFGVTYVDYANGRARYPKDSAQFLTNFFTNWNGPSA